MKFNKKCTFQDLFYFSNYKRVSRVNIQIQKN